jgi:hypothetical protein
MIWIPGLGYSTTVNPSIVSVNPNKEEDRRHYFAKRRKIAIKVWDLD